MTGRILYGVYDPNIGGRSFGIKPYDDKYWATYAKFTRRVSLARDFGWHEVKHLQRVFRNADIWSDFPAVGYSLITAESRVGDEDQRLDLLYLRNDGAILPCELKIGGSSKDAHGQLIRYLSDLYFQTINLKWIEERNSGLINTISDAVAQDLHKKKFAEFISSNAIADPYVRLLPRTGMLIDEGFAPQALKAVRYLNGNCGFSFRLMEIRTFVADDWTNTSTDFLYRMEIVDIQ